MTSDRAARIVTEARLFPGFGSNVAERTPTVSVTRAGTLGRKLTESVRVSDGCMSPMAQIMNPPWLLHAPEGASTETMSAPEMELERTTALAVDGPRLTRLRRTLAVFSGSTSLGEGGGGCPKYAPPGQVRTRQAVRCHPPPPPRRAP